MECNSSKGRTNLLEHGEHECAGWFSRSILRCTETGREKVLEVSYSLRSSLFTLTAVARQRTDQLCGRDRSVLPNNGQPVFRGLCQTALLLGRILPFRIRERTRNDAGRFTADAVDRCPTRVPSFPYSGKGNYSDNLILSENLFFLSSNHSNVRVILFSLYNRAFVPGRPIRWTIDKAYTCLCKLNFLN